MKNQKEDLYRPNKIRTHSGCYLDPFDPDPGEICIEDIAHALSHTCRFAGHTRSMFTVAQHSWQVAKQADTDHQLAALLHDASEAYLGDIPSPIKRRLPSYIEVEQRLMACIADKFSFTYPLHEQIKFLDKRFLELEWEVMVLGRGNYIPVWSPGYAKESFLKMFKTIKQ